MNMYAEDLKVCMETMELTFERYFWDYVEAFQREGLSLKEIPDDLNDANKAMRKVKDAMHNCNKLLKDLEETNETNIKNRREKKEIEYQDYEHLPKRSGRYPWGSVEKTDSNS